MTEDDRINEGENTIYVYTVVLVSGLTYTAPGETVPQISVAAARSN
jgi:hypothetical protein